MADEPTIAFVLYASQWISVMHPVTKLELVDWVAIAGANFFFDLENKAYVLLLKKTVWDNLNETGKKRFQLISRRVREELDGPFTEEQRIEFEQRDPFEVFNKPATAAPETIPEVDGEGEEPAEDAEPATDIKEIAQ